MSFSRDSIHPSMSPAEEAEVLLTAVYGRRRGFVTYVKGVHGSFTKSGHYKHRPWCPRFFRWPEEHPALLRAILRDCKEHDVYVGATLRRSRSAKLGFGLDVEYTWADVDSAPGTDLSPITDLLVDGSLIVYSGQPGHMQIWIKLDRLYEAAEVEEVNRPLARFLHADLTKWRENTVLRVPGTWNYKGKARGGDPYPVTLTVVENTGRPPWSLHALRERLGGESALPRQSQRPARRRETNQTRRHETIVPVEEEPIDPSILPERIRRRIMHVPARPNGRDHSNSGQLYALVAMMKAECIPDKHIMSFAALQPARSGEVAR